MNLTWFNKTQILLVLNGNHEKDNLLLIKYFIKVYEHKKRLKIYFSFSKIQIGINFIFLTSSRMF